mmetsp:Transcript_13198/g.28549  ORF Transcript_13198/g.28549 Transcript_13198/m.28549 type:complete len:222 (-) Transcript_13198:202-867(-)
MRLSLLPKGLKRSQSISSSKRSSGGSNRSRNSKRSIFRFRKRHVDDRDGDQSFDQSFDQSQMSDLSRALSKELKIMASQSKTKSPPAEGRFPSSECRYPGAEHRSPPLASKEKITFKDRPISKDKIRQHHPRRGRKLKNERLLQGGGCLEEMHELADRVGLIYEPCSRCMVRMIFPVDGKTELVRGESRSDDNGNGILRNYEAVYSLVDESTEHSAGRLEC